MRIYESVPAFTVRAEVGKGQLRVTGTDAFGRRLFATEGKPGEPKLAVTLPGPDYYALRAEVVENGKTVKSAETSLMVTTPLPGDYYSTPHPAFGVWGGLTPELRRDCQGPNGTGNFFLPSSRNRTPQRNLPARINSPPASRSKSSAA